MPNIKIKDVHGKDHTYSNINTLRVRDADIDGGYIEYTFKEGTVNVSAVGECDVNEFAKANVTVREYTSEMEADHNETLDIVNDLLTIIGEMEDDGNADNQEGIEETDSEQ